MTPLEVCLNSEKTLKFWYFARFALPLSFARRYSRSRKLKKLLVFFSLIRTFAGVKTKRHIAAWVLLAVFVPMVVLSSLHAHTQEQVAQEDCKECVAHHCHGHFVELTTTMHACVLCQFQTFSFVAAALFAVVLFHRFTQKFIAQRQGYVLLDVCGIPLLRAPPFLIKN